MSSFLGDSGLKTNGTWYHRIRFANKGEHFHHDAVRTDSDLTRNRGYNAELLLTVDHLRDRDVVCWWAVCIEDSLVVWLHVFQKKKCSDPARRSTLPSLATMVSITASSRKRKKRLTNRFYPKGRPRGFDPPGVSILSNSRTQARETERTSRDGLSHRSARVQDHNPMSMHPPDTNVDHIQSPLPKDLISIHS